MSPLTALLFATLLLATGAPAGPTPFRAEVLPQVAYHTGGLAYWDTPYQANAMAMASNGWMEFAPNTWGTTIRVAGNPQFDENGFPKYLRPGLNLRAILYGLHVQSEARPASWPDRGALARGHVVVTWKGNADVRLSGGPAYLSEESSGPATGRLADGRRVYRFGGQGTLQTLDVHDIDTSAPITDIKVWLADPEAPQTKSLEGKLWHPTFLARVREAEWGVVRMMNLTETNGSPVQDWADRRLPSHAFQTGVLNDRAPATGASGNRPTGVAFEHLVALCNETERDLWINIPHLATDEFIAKLARLIRFGSDGREPYAGPVANPVWAPLAPTRRIYVEYSNEIWSNGGSFPQGNWAQAQADAAGISKAQFNARRFCEVWSIFQREFGGADRLVRVAAIFTAVQSYSEPFLREIVSYGATLNPPTDADVIAITTYFGNDIQGYIDTRARAAAGGADPWFYTTETFDPGNGSARPVTILPGDPYWTSAAFARHQREALDEWLRRMLSGDARRSAGPDATGFTGGFETWVHTLANTVFAAPKPVVAYEGGPSLYTDNIDWGDRRDDGVTMFCEALNRNPGFVEVYRAHLNMAKSKGLWTHSAFVDSSRWGKYGQWGHLEYIDAPTSDSPKWEFMKAWTQEGAALRHVDRPAGAVPAWTTGYTLPAAELGKPYAAEVLAAGGDGALRVELLAAALAKGLAVVPVAGDPNRLRIEGTPTTPDVSYFYARAVDADGDAAWRTFTARSVGGPGTLVESDFSGTNPARALPWTRTYVVDSGVSWSGWTRGAGIVVADGDDRLAFSVNAPANEADSTLALAINDNEYWSATVSPGSGRTISLRGRELRLTVRRQDYHAPRRYAIFTSIGGFAAGQEVFTTAHNSGTDDQLISITLPDTAAYENLTVPVEIRVVGFAGQWGGHRTAITAFKLYGGVQ